jgi:glycosyltransferase involved in cell wall biosynthesis
MRGDENLKDCNSDLFVSSIDFRERNRNKSIRSGIGVLARVIYSREACQKFGRLLERTEPDIVHLQNIHGHISPSVIFQAKRRGLPVVWTLHDYKMICPNTHFVVDRTGEICQACLLRGYHMAILKRCKKDSLLASTVAAIEAYAHAAMGIRGRVEMFCTPSAFLREALIRGGFSPSKVTHIPLFLPERILLDRVGSCAEGRGNCSYILFMARLDPIKGIYPLLDACRMVPEVRLKMAGRVEDSMAKQVLSKLPANAEYLGMRHEEDLRRILEQCMAVVLPSLCFENQPFTVTEAFAAGKPVIASDLGGMKELIRHGESGLLVPPGDAGALAEAMRWIADHPAEAKIMGSNAREYALKQHSAAAHYEALLQVYKHAVQEVRG